MKPKAVLLLGAAALMTSSCASLGGRTNFSASPGWKIHERAVADINTRYAAMDRRIEEENSKRASGNLGKHYPSTSVTPKAVERLEETPLVTVEPLGIKARPISKHSAITAAVARYEKTDEVDSLIVGNNLILYPYGLEQARLVCAKLRVCSIELQEGEEILNTHTGDSQRWNISFAYSGAGETLKPHVMVKPLSEAPLATNLIITTDKRVYDIHLSSVDEGTFTPRIGFYYPQELAELDADAALAAEKYLRHKEVPETTKVELQTLNFNYKVKGNRRRPWYPKRVFDDGSKVFIEMPESIKSSELPVLLVVENGNQEVANYRFRFPYYIVDRLFNKGVLVLGSQRITILRE